MTDVPLREHMERQIVALHTLIMQRLDLNDRAIEAALRSAADAVEKAEVASNKRFDSVNEFREQLADVIRTFLSRDLAEVSFKNVDERLRKVSDELAVLRQAAAEDQARDDGSRENKLDSRAFFIAIFGLLLSIVAVATSVLTALT